MIKPDKQKFTAGVVLVLFGLGFYMARKLDAVGSEVIMLIIGAAFLVGYFYQKAHALLIPAGILLGLGAGGLLQERLLWHDQWIQLGLGGGFLAIYVIARIYERTSHWWPLIPGAILIFIGVPKTKEIWELMKANWPLILVAIGLLVLIGAFRRGTAPEPRPASAPTPAPAPPSEPEQPVEPKIE